VSRPLNVTFGAEVDQLPHVLGVEGSEVVTDVDSPVPGLAAQSMRVIVAGRHIDERGTASRDVNVVMAQRQRLTDPHAGLGEDGEQEPVPQPGSASRPPVFGLYRACVEDRGDLCRLQDRGD